MAESWPVGIQNKFNEQGYNETIGDTTIRSATDIGLPKVRRRFTKGVDILTGTIWITKSQVNTFKDFYDTTLNGGVLTFNFTDPYTDTLTEFRFNSASPPKFDPVGGENFNVTLQMERIPV